MPCRQRNSLGDLERPRREGIEIALVSRRRGCTSTGDESIESTVRVDILVSKDVFPKAGEIFRPHVCPCHWTGLIWLRGMIYRFPSEVKALMQIPFVVWIGVFAKEGGIPFEVWRRMDVQLRTDRSRYESESA